MDLPQDLVQETRQSHRQTSVQSTCQRSELDIADEPLNPEQPLATGAVCLEGMSGVPAEGAAVRAPLSGTRSRVRGPPEMRGGTWPKGSLFSCHRPQPLQQVPSQVPGVSIQTVFLSSNSLHAQFLIPGGSTLHIQLACRPCQVLLLKGCPA